MPLYSRLRKMRKIMGRYKKIDDASLSKLNNAEYATFMQAAYPLFFPAVEDEEEPDDGGSPGTVSLVEGNPELGISQEDKEAFEKELTLMVDLVEYSRISEETKPLKESDDRRDDLIVYLNTAVRTQSKSPIAAHREMANKVYNVMKPYFGIQRDSVEEKTSKIDGLLMDAEKEGFPEMLETMGLTSVIDELRKENEAFKSMTTTRMNRKSDNAIESGAAVRARLDEVYENMTTVAFATSVLSPSAATTTFVSRLNTLIEKTKAKNKQRLSLYRANAKKKEEGTEATTKTRARKAAKAAAKEAKAKAKSAEAAPQAATPQKSEEPAAREASVSTVSGGWTSTQTASPVMGDTPATPEAENKKGR